MQSAQMKMVKSYLTNLKSLKKLKFVNMCHFRLQDSAIPIFIEEKLLHLQKLDLSHNLLTHRAVKLLSLCQYDYLTEFIIDRNAIGSQGLVNFALIKWPSLVSARLNAISCTSKGIESFSRHYSRNLSKLQFKFNICNVNSLRCLLKSKPFNISTSRYKTSIIINCYANQRSRALWSH